MVKTIRNISATCGLILGLSVASLAANFTNGGVMNMRSSSVTFHTFTNSGTFNCDDSNLCIKHVVMPGGTSKTLKLNHEKLPESWKSDPKCELCQEYGEKATVHLTDNAVVDGDIIFENCEGIVFVERGSKITGSVKGGKVVQVKQDNKKQDNK